MGGLDPTPEIWGPVGSFRELGNPGIKKVRLGLKGKCCCHLESASHQPALSSSETNSVPHSSSEMHSARQSHCPARVPWGPGVWKLIALSLPWPQVTKGD